MLKKISALVLIISFFSSCKKECNCEVITYSSNYQNNYNWTETARNMTNNCNSDTLYSTWLDSSNYISYVYTVIECEN